MTDATSKGGDGWTRGFQMWDYSPSHRVLLLRSPAQSDDDKNIDLVFRGVRDIQLATFVSLMPFTPFEEEAETGPEGDPLTRYEIPSRGHRYSVLAESYNFEENDQDLFETIPDATRSLRVTGRQYELSVVSALSAALPTYQVRPTELGVDVELTRGAARVLVEIKRTDATPPERLIRRLVTQLVSQLGDVARSTNTGVLVVLGGSSSAVAAELQRHLVTALGSYEVRAVPWDSGDSTVELTAAVQSLSARAT
jgi:hypothetical protein